jgi:hypothetical protein
VAERAAGGVAVEDLEDGAEHREVVAAGGGAASDVAGLKRDPAGAAVGGEDRGGVGKDVGELEERPPELRPALHQAEEERPRAAADVDDRAGARKVEALAERPAEGQRQRGETAQRRGVLRVGLAPGVLGGGPAAADRLGGVAVGLPDRGQDLVGAAEVARAAGDQELRGFRAGAEAPVLDGEQAGGGEGVEQAGEAVGVDAEPGGELVGGQGLGGERG